MIKNNTKDEYVDGKNLILYEDNHLIIVRKNASDIVQGDNTGDEPLSERIKKFLKEKYKKPGNVYLGVVHRIDRPVSGVVIFSKTSKSVARLNKMFQEKTISKTYWAVVESQPPKNSGVCKSTLKKNAKQNKSYVVEKGTKGAKEGILEYKWMGTSDNYFLLEIYPTTGRHHQIRAQLAEMGCPIKGDIKYGAKRTNKDASIHLHARSINFIHPVKKEEMTITAPLPNEPLWAYFNSMQQKKK